MVTRPIIMWSSTWSNTWPTNIIFLEANKPYLHYYQTRHCHSRSETSIKPTTLEARRGHQLIDRQTLLLSLLTLSTRSFIGADQAASAHIETPSQIYESLIKPLACAISSYQCQCLSASNGVAKVNPRHRGEPWVKRQEDGWLDAVREPTLRTSISASFHWSSIGDRSLLIVRNPREESRLGLDRPAGLDYRPDG